MTGFLTANYYMVTERKGPQQNVHPMRKYLYSEANPFKYQYPAPLPASKERIRCWVQSGREPVRRFVPNEPQPLQPAGQPVAMQEVVSGTELISYFVSDQGSIYELDEDEEGFHGTKISLSDVLDPDVRARIAEEVQKVSIKP